MDFLYSIKNIDDIFSFEKYIFSIGTFEGSDRFRQLLNSTTKYNNTIIFAIDQQYKLLELDDIASMKIENISFTNTSKKTKLQTFYNKELNMMIVFIPENIQSSYYEIGKTHNNFMYTIDCKAMKKEWILFERFLLELIEKNKKIYINNWVIFNTRYYEKKDEKMVYRYRNTGFFFEYFPELGYILYSVYKLYPNSKLFINVEEKFLPISQIFNLNK